MEGNGREMDKKKCRRDTKIEVYTNVRKATWPLSFPLTRTNHNSCTFPTDSKSSPLQCSFRSSTSASVLPISFPTTPLSHRGMNSQQEDFLSKQNHCFQLQSSFAKRKTTMLHFLKYLNALYTRVLVPLVSFTLLLSTRDQVPAP